MTGELTAAPCSGSWCRPAECRRRLQRRLGMVKAVADSVDELLDGEQRDQRAGQRDRGIERGDRRIRRQPETAEAPEIVDVAVIDQDPRHRQHHDADHDLDDQPRRAMHRLGDRRQIEMIVAAGGDGGADEDGIDEQRRGRLLQPQPWAADGPRDDVGRDRQRESKTQYAADDHQDQFEPVERPPLQMMLPLQHQFVGNGHRRILRRRICFASWPSAGTHSHRRLLFAKLANLSLDR